MNRPWRQQWELISSLAKRDLKTRYKESVLGFFWSLLRPAFLTLILWLVFSLIVPIRFDQGRVPYWMHVLVSVLAWNFLVGSLFDAAGSILANANLLKKVKLDAEVFPVSSALANAVHFALALALVLVIVAVVGPGLGVNLLLLPAALALEVLLILGLGFFLSALNVFYRDVGSALELGVMAWFYITPIIYPLQEARRSLGRFGDIWFHLYMLNPMAPIVGLVRRAVLYGPNAELSDRALFAYAGVSAVVSLCLFASGWMLFRRMSGRFADEL